MFLHIHDRLEAQEPPVPRTTSIFQGNLGLEYIRHLSLQPALGWTVPELPGGMIVA